jgi:hypothetical protein
VLGRHVSPPRGASRATGPRAAPRARPSSRRASRRRTTRARDAGLELLVDRPQRHAGEQHEQRAVERLLRRPRVARREPDEHAEPAVLEQVRHLVAVRERAWHVESGLGAEDEDQGDVAGHEQPASLDVGPGALDLDSLRHRRPPPWDLSCFRDERGKLARGARVRNRRREGDRAARPLDCGGIPTREEVPS